jgi:hypothetical protein
MNQVTVCGSGATIAALLLGVVWARWFLSFLDALNDKDLKAVRSHLDDDVTFTSTDGARVQGAEAYLRGLEADRLRIRGQENVCGW